MSTESRNGEADLISRLRHHADVGMFVTDACAKLLLQAADALQSKTAPRERKAIIEECAKVCDEMAENIRDACERNYTSDDYTAHLCAEAIRALKSANK